MINFLDVAPGLVTLLAPLAAAGVAVRSPVDVPQQQGTAQTATATVTAILLSVTPATRASLDGTTQARRYEIGLQCRSARLSGPTGLYTLPVEIDRLCTGKAVAGLGRLDFAEFRLVERTADYWEGVVVFSVVRMDC